MSNPLEQELAMEAMAMTDDARERWNERLIQHIGTLANLLGGGDPRAPSVRAIADDLEELRLALQEPPGERRLVWSERRDIPEWIERLRPLSRGGERWASDLLSWFRGLLAQDRIHDPDPEPPGERRYFKPASERPHKFLPPNTDYCAICGYDEPHSLHDPDPEPEHPGVKEAEEVAFGEHEPKTAFDNNADTEEHDMTANEMLVLAKSVYDGLTDEQIEGIEDAAGIPVVAAPATSESGEEPTVVRCNWCGVIDGCADDCGRRQMDRVSLVDELEGAADELEEHACLDHRRDPHIFREAARRLRRAPDEGVGEREKVEIDAGMIAFLLGEGPLLGYWFGEIPEGERGRFWWRKYLREGTSPEALRRIHRGGADG